VSEAELTEPYALLLAEGLFEQAEAETRAIETGQSTRNKAGSALKRSAGPVSIYEHMAEREGFEPSNEVSPVTRFPVAPVQPLRHLSSAWIAGAAIPVRSTRSAAAT
jgi:hypothetical protein